MAQSYTRQSTFADGDTITAALFNDEYNQLLNAFAYSNTSAASTGHRHDGTAGQGGNIHTIGDLDFNNKIVVDSTNNRWGFYVEVSSAAVEQIRIQDGAMIPVTDSDVDLGTSSLYWKDAYIDSVTTTGNISIGGNLTVTGNATISGNLTFGDADTDSITLTADVASSITPDTDDTYDLGSASKEWRDIYIDGTAYLDAINFNGTAITATAAELNIMDGVTATATEINIIDGDTAATATTLADADRVIVNDAGTMKQVALKDFETYFETSLDTLSNVTTVGALNSGSITSGFGAIDTGSSNITTTGTVSFGSLTDGAITITAFVDEDNMASDSATLIPTQQSVKAYVDSQIGGVSTSLSGLSDTNITTPADGALLFYDAGTSMWIDNVVSGDITIADTGVAAISSGVIVNDDIKASEAISISKTALVDGTGLTLTGDTLAVDASQTQITSVGTLDSLTVSGDLTIDTSTLKVDSTNNRVGILNATPDVTLDIGSATDAIHMPVGTTAQRPTGAAGYFRYNTDLGQFEGYTDEWGSIAGSGGASAVEQQIFAGTGSQTDFTLTTAPATENNLLVFIDGVFQAQDSYSVSGTTLTFSTAPVSGRVITVYHVRSSVSGANMIVDSMTGDGSDTTLTLSVAPVSVNNIQVYFDGVYQAKSNYSVSGTTLTFTTAPPSGVAVEAITHTQTSVNVPVDGTITPAKIASGDFYFDTDTLYIDATNNRVGIGATSLNADLHIGSANAVGDATNPAFQIGGSPTGNTYRLGLYTSAEGGVIENKNGDDGLQFKVKTAGEAMRIDGGTGNVGIGGTPVAGAKLQSQGALFVNGVISAAPSSPTLAIDYASGGARFISYDHSTNNPRIYFITSSSTSTNERMRIDSSGTLLVGTTDDAHYGGSTNSGFAVTNSGITGISRSAGTVLYVNRQTSDGDIITFRKDGSTKGRIGTKGGDVFIGGDTHLRFTTGDIRPCDSNGDNQDNFTDLGDSSARFDDIFATNGTIQTSDRDEKQDIAELTDAETRVAVAAKGLLRKFRWQSAVEEKGDEARIHFGIIAQDLQDAFTAEGLDAGDYAMFISTTWWETQTEVAAVEAVEEVTDEEGNVITEAVEAKDAYTRIDTYNTAEEAPEGATEKTRLGVRYSELLAFIIAAI